MRISDWSSDVCSSDLKIVDPLLLIHGLSDDNVVFDNSSQLMAKMQAATQPFETMLYPGKTHSISGVSAHVYLTILNFLNRHVGLPPEIGRASCRERVCQYV